MLQIERYLTKWSLSFAFFSSGVMKHHFYLEQVNLGLVLFYIYISNQCFVQRMWHQQKQSVKDRWMTVKVNSSWHFALFEPQKPIHVYLFTKQWQYSEECMRHLRNIAMRDSQESVTTGQTHGWTDRQTPDKVIPMCRYASQVTQKSQ